MVEPQIAKLWFRRAQYLLISACLIFLYLLPLQIDAPRWAAPDLLLCLTMVWIVRRPEYVPALSVAGVFLLADIFFQRPLGLSTAAAVLAAEFLRSRSPFMRDFPFVVEWLVVGTVMLATLLATRLVLILSVLTPPPLWLEVMQAAMTVLAYPVIVALCRYGLGLDRATAREQERRGMRI